jgi:hypothetical protein
MPDDGLELVREVKHVAQTRGLHLSAPAGVGIITIVTTATGAKADNVS